MQIVVLDISPERFYPLCETRPVWDLLYGIYYAHERITYLLEKSFASYRTLLFQTESSREELFKREYPYLDVRSNYENEDTLFLNPFLSSLDFIESGKKDVVYTSGGIFAAALVSKEKIKETSFVLGLSECSLPESMTIEDIGQQSIALPSFIWNLVSTNGDKIKEDFALSQIRATAPDDLTVIGERDQVFIADNVRIDPFVVFDTTKGPIYISRNTVINSFTRIEGPSFVGEHSLLLGALVREGTSIGRHCRIGGEIEDAIVHSYSNKYHDGFIGHSYLGQWVNIGAMGTGSDLKNDYSTVDVFNNGELVDTGEIKVGSFIGDHTKLSIGALLNTGAVVGCCSMIIHSGRMAPSHTPSFSLFIKNELREVKGIDQTVAAMKKVLSRRNMTMDGEYEKYIREKFEKQRAFRNNEIERWNKKLS